MSPGGLAGHSAALIGFRDSVRYLGSLSCPHEDCRASNLGHAEIEGSEPSPGIFNCHEPRVSDNSGNPGVENP